MKMTRMIPFMILLSTCLLPSLQAGWSEIDRADFEDAGQAYRNANFEKAIELYSGLIAKHPYEGSLYYNLGNAHYRRGNAGQAILAYERSLLHNPRSRDARDNLYYVRGLLEYKIEDKRNWYIQFAEKALRYITEREVAILTLGALFLFLVSWTFVIYFKRGTPVGFIRKGFFVLTLFSVVLFGAKEVQVRVVKPAIILGNEVEVRYGPSDTDQTAFRLGEGLKVYVVDQREKWNRILLSNGESGWVGESKMALIQSKKV